MDALRLRFPSLERDDLPLGHGVHLLGPDPTGRLGVVAGPEQGRVQLCIDRRGIWLQLREGIRGVHVNGRPVRRMAMLRPGDAIHVDGVELLLLGATPMPAPGPAGEGGDVHRHQVLRGTGGFHHGRCFTLDRPRVIGSGEDADIRILAPGVAAAHARLEPHAEGLVVRAVAPDTGFFANGHRVRDVLLEPGAQLLFGSGQRFVLEAPIGRSADVPAAPIDDGGEAMQFEDQRHPPATHGLRRLPWLLGAALLLAGVLTLLLMFGAR